MTEATRIIVMGGPGRSGTTYLAAALGAHPAVASFPRVELKFLFERDGLVDLGWTLCESFSPNRAWVALARFRTLMNQLRNGGFDQPLLEGPGVYRGVNLALERFYDAIAPEGIGRPMEYPAYRAAARRFFGDIVALGVKAKPGTTHFLEKTPHTLLAPRALADFADDPHCLHVIRDPRGTAVSLVSQGWGPDSLSRAIAWVQSYYHQWFAVRGLYAEQGTPLDEMRIEDVVRAPREHGNRLLARLGLAPQDVFADADGGQLTRGRDCLAPADLSLLDDRLGALAARLGYPDAWAANQAGTS